jgi:probable phosphoglycerate mutase
VRFTFVRHGEIEEPAPGLAETGHDDPALTAHGRRQAAAIASELFEALDRGTAYEAIYTSPLRAARTTAEALAAVLDIGEPRVAHELSTLTPEVLPADGGTEALQALQERAWSAVQSLKERFEAQSNIVIVTHDLTIRSLVCRALEMPLEEMHRFDLEPASLTTIEFRIQGQRERTIIVNLNETCHLEQ